MPREPRLLSIDPADLDAAFEAMEEADRQLLAEATGLSPEAAESYIRLMEPPAAGLAFPSGPAQAATICESIEDFTRTFGGPLQDSPFLAAAAYLRHAQRKP